MKKLGMFLMFVLAMAVAMPTSYAQLNTLSKKEEKRLAKEVKKEAKRLTKEGWKVAPGNPSLEMQLMESFRYQMQKDEFGYDKFIQGEAMSTGTVYDAAMFQADNLAKVNLAGKMETRVIGIIDNKLANEQITQEEANSLAKTVGAGKNLVAQRLGQIIVPVKMYREQPNGSVQVRIISYYSQALAMKAAKQVLRDELEKEANSLADKVEEILGE